MQYPVIQVFLVQSLIPSRFRLELPYQLAYQKCITSAKHNRCNMASLKSAVKTRLLIISDTHEGRSTEDYSTNGAFRQPLPKADVLLHSGDLTMIGATSENEKALDFLETIDAPLKLVIAGNHDLSLDEEYYNHNPSAKKWVEFIPGGKWDATAPQKARELWTGARAKKAGVTYLEEGLYSFNLQNGARLSIYASPWQPEFFDWAFNYPKSEDRWNPPELVTGERVVPAPPERRPNPIPADAKVDIVMTHGPAHTHLDRTESGYLAGCPHLLKALARVRPQLFCCGHIHEGWGAERVLWDVKGEGTVGESIEVLAGISEDGSMVRPADEAVVKNRAACFDFSQASARPLHYGKETLMINSAVVTTQYQPGNAAFLVDIDLPKFQSGML